MNKTKENIIRDLKSTKRKGIENLLSWLDATDFYTAPASTMFHGNYEGGLAEHSYLVYQEFADKARHFGLSIPEESAVISGICHDFCKINNYEPNVLKSGNRSESKPYKVKDLLPIGHGEKSLVLANRFIEITPREAVLIRWHMGYEDPAWEEYKDKVEKDFPEVILFQHADKEVSLIKRI